MEKDQKMKSGLKLKNIRQTLHCQLNGFSAKNSIFSQIVVLLSLVMAFQPQLTGEIVRWNDR